MVFIHLHVYTGYSLFDGSGKIPELVQRAKDLGQTALAVTDHGIIYGVIDFYKAAKAAGIKSILGHEIYVTPGSRFDRDNKKGEARYYHLTLLAENNEGYENLTKIVSRGFVDGFYYEPRVDLETLREFSKGTIASSACLAGEVARNLAVNRYKDTKEAALRYRDIFGRESFFLGSQDHGLGVQKVVNQQLIRLSRGTGIPLIATNDTHYTNPEDQKAHDLLLCLQTGKKASDANRIRYEGGQYYLKSEEEMRVLFAAVPEALENTAKIAARCEVEICFHELKLPAYDVPADYPGAESYLYALSEEGFWARYPEEPAALRACMEEELDVINRMGYVDHFLIAWGYIHYAKEHGISMGPGCGSVAGSVVSYCLGTTDIDLEKYQLVFERFLNPERVSTPDIDVDLAYERRQEVINYAGRKYGKERVVQIITFGTLAAEGVVRDVGYVLDLPYARCDQIAKLIPNDLKMTLDKALVQPKELRALYEGDEGVRHLIGMSGRLEGLSRHASIHAAGVVTSKKAAEEYVPLARGADGSITTQFDMNTLEELGLLKMNFLGLRTLIAVQNTAAEVEKRSGKPIDIFGIDFNDSEVMALIGGDSTESIFQLESVDMKNFMKELKPATLEDIIAGISLYRSGPMDFILRYLEGRDHPEEARYECPQLETILKPTYGYMVCQEQITQIVRGLANYTWGRSDLVRRAMGKKKESVMRGERKNFVYSNEDEGIRGCMNNGISEEVVNHLFDEMMDFASYAFNKGHVTCYAYVSFQTAWLKHYYPKEFMAALMTSVTDNSSKTAEYILVCRQMGIPILPPDVDDGQFVFLVSGDGIRLGPPITRAAGIGVSKEIVRERGAGGASRSFEDFIERLPNKEANRRALESFVKAGALDSMPGSRRQKLLLIPELLDKKAKQKNAVVGQVSFLDFLGKEACESLRTALLEVEEFRKEDLLAFEKGTAGVYLSGHPLDDVRELWKKIVTAKTVDFLVDNEGGSATLSDHEQVVIGDVLTNVTTKIMRDNDMMAFLTIEDLVGTVEVLLFPRVYERYRELLTSDAKLFLSGRVTLSGDKAAGKLICEWLPAFGTGQRTLWLQFADESEFREKRGNLLLALGNSEGQDTVKIYCRTEKKIIQLGRNWRVAAEEELLQALRAAFGTENVKMTVRQSL